jgi:hypothetical protein
MRCLSCDVILSNDEATAKSPITDEYLDMCNACLDTIVRAENPISSSSEKEDGGDFLWSTNG